jgi:hypothetical protein
MKTANGHDQTTLAVMTVAAGSSTEAHPIEGGMFGSVQSADAVHLHGATAGSVQAGRDLEMQDSYAFAVMCGNDVHATDAGGTIFAAGRDVHVENGGGAIFTAGRDVKLKNGGAALLWAGHDLTASAAPAAAQVAGNVVRTDEPGSLLVAAREAYVKAGTVGVVLAGKANFAPETRVLVTISPDNLAGALVGLACFLPVQLWRRLRG